MSYSQDLKKRVLLHIKKGSGKTEAAALFSVGRSTIYKWLSEPDDHQPRKPGPKDSRKFKRCTLRQLLEANPDMLQKELAAHLNVSVNAISRALMRMGMVRKKRLYVISKASHMKTGGGVT